MKINWEHGVINAKLNLDYFKSLTLEKDKFCDFSVFYDDIDFHDQLDSLCCELSERNEWYYYDEYNVETDLIFTIEDGEVCVSLALKVQPPKYSKEDQEEILSTASKDLVFPDSTDEYERQWSWHNHWLEVFEAAEQYHNGSGDWEDMEFYDIELSDEEKQALTITPVGC